MRSETWKEEGKCCEKMWWESVGFKGEEIGFGFIYELELELQQRIDSNSLDSVNSKQ